MLETKERFKIDRKIEHELRNIQVSDQQGQDITAKKTNSHVQIEECPRDVIERIIERVKRI